MKKVFFSMIAILMLSTTVLMAQEPVKNEAKEGQAAIEQQVPVQDEKVEIKAEELPQAVRTTLATEEYKDWTIEKAYHLKTLDYYEVKLKNGAESKSVKFDKDGNVV
ncbi:MAG: hypothetical protein KF845_13925 [Cyclobacteriaceae bacterium]|nr:hypothetical protein [Cyclobacteriaceae bacterium]